MIRRKEGGAVEEEMRQEEKNRRELELDERRKEYIRRLQTSTRELTDRMRRSEQLTAEHFAFHVNATQLREEPPQLHASHSEDVRGRMTVRWA